MIARVLALLLLVILQHGCGPREQERPEAVFENARRQYRLSQIKESLARLDRALVRWREPASEWHWRFLLLKTEILAASGQPKNALALLDTPVPPPSGELAARRQLNIGFARLRLGEAGLAKRLLDEAYRLAEETKSAALLAEVENRRGAALSMVSDHAAAEASFAGALRYARQSGDPYLEMAALGNLGVNRLMGARYDEAIPYFEQVLPLSEKGGYGLIRAITLHNLGVCFSRLGDFDKALKLLSDAQASFEKTDYPAGLQAVLGDAGSLHYYRRDLPAALSFYQKALALAEKTDNTRSAAAWLSNLAMVSVDLGDLDAAEKFNRRAMELVAGSGDRRNPVYAALNSARVAAGRNQTLEAEKTYREALRLAADLNLAPAIIEGYARLGSLYARAGDWRNAERQFRAMFSTLEAGRTRFKREEWKLTYQSSVAPFFEDYVNLLMDRGRIEAALEVAESCRARVLAEKLGPAAAVPVRPPAARSFQSKAAAARAVLLSYWLGRERSFLWAITAKGISSFALPPERDIRSLVEAYNNAIVNLEDPRETLHPAGRALEETLVGPVRPLVPPGSNVIVAPDGVLFELNFETLLAGGRPRYWVEEATIAVTPSLALLDRQPSGHGAPPRSILLIGSPISPAPEYPPLPDAEAEVKAIRERFSAGMSEVFTGPEAYPGVYGAAQPGRFSLIHFSAHAVANRESPLDSAVILSRRGDAYKLYAREVTEVPLKADLVTISACRGVGVRLYAGEGLVGFSWAFLRAGARSVIAGLWDVNDRSTSLLMARLYEEISKGKAPAEALRIAKLEFLKQPTYRRPYHWAPFVMFTRIMPFRG